MRNIKRREETRASILEAAAQCFVRQGYRKAGVAKICAEAGVSKGAFYYHFESKEAVLLELLNEPLARLESMFEDVAAGSPDIPEALRRMSLMLREIFSAEDDLLIFLLELWSEASRNEKVRKATVAPFNRFKEMLASLIERGVKEGSLRDVDSQVGAQAIVSIASGLFLQGLLEPDDSNWGKSVEECVQVLLQGLERK